MAPRADQIADGISLLGVGGRSALGTGVPPPPENNRINLGRSHKSGMQWEVASESETESSTLCWSVACHHVPS